MGWERAEAFKSLFKSLTELRKALKFGDELICLGKVCMSLEGNRLHWIHSLTFMSSNLTCYHTEFTNTKMVFPPSPPQTDWGARAAMQNSRSVQKAPGGTGMPQVHKSEITYYTRERSSLCKQLCWLKTAAGHCPQSSTLERTPEPSFSWLRQTQPR